MGMKRLLILGSFILGNFAILVVAFALITIVQTRSSSADEENAALVTTKMEAKDLAVYNTVPTTPEQPTGSIIESDARARIVDKFFLKYSSPMTGQGRTVVASADKHRIPFNLLPAIATCEGNAGRTMPTDSYNTYGWGVYGDKVTKFASWEEGIEVVSAGLRTGYYDKGLTTPEAIMTKYAPPSNGSWAVCVNQFMAEMI